MNTTFKILWFEDEPAWFNMEKLRIEEILGTHYLIPVIERKDGDDFDLEEITGNDYDLIFMDYKLAERKTGDTIVAAIRNSDILTDILFYSSEEQNMLSAIRAQMPPIDGVYLTKRDYTIFTEKAQRIIEKIVKRSEDVVNLRGFVLDNTSAFEVRIREILNICWQKFTEEQRDALTQTLTKLLESKAARVSNQIDTVQHAECTFTYANNDEYMLGIADRLDILQTVLPILTGEYKMPSTIVPSKFKQYYIEQVNRYRNKLSHITLGEKTIHINGRDVEINQDLHRLLRRNISEVDSKIQEIETYITNHI
jgi:CheY-like chemotaxis protein